MMVMMMMMMMMLTAGGYGGRDDYDRAGYGGRGYGRDYDDRDRYGDRRGWDDGESARIFHFLFLFFDLTLQTWSLL